MNTDLTTWRVAPTLSWLESYGTWLHFDYIKRGGGELSPKSLEACLQDARHLSRWFEQYSQGGFAPELISAEVVRAYFQWQEAVKDRPATRNRRLASLRTMVKWSVATGLLTSDPTLRQSRARQQRLPRKAKDKAEIEALETAAVTGSHLKRRTQSFVLLGQRDRIIWSLFANSTLRIEMIVNLDVEGIDLAGEVMRMIGKGGVEIELPINAELKRDLAEWLAVRPGAGPALVTDGRGNRLTTGQVRRRLYQIASAAGVQVRPHDMRHTRVEGIMRAALSSGMPMEKALDITQTLAGHADKRTTMTYLRASREELALVNGRAG